MLSSFQPRRILTVKGIVTAARTASKMRAISGRSRSRPEPPLQATTRLAGQPRFRSTMSKPASSTIFAASASVRGSEPKSCAAIGMLVVVVGEVALALGFAHAGRARRRR